MTHRVTVERPTFALRIERIEDALAFANAARFSGQVNARPWQGLPAKSWLMSISSEQIEPGRHRVTYSAVYNKKTWRATLIQTLNGIIPEPVPTIGNGVIVRDVYESEDYNALRLPRVL